VAGFLYKKGGCITSETATLFCSLLVRFTDHIILEIIVGVVYIHPPQPRTNRTNIRNIRKGLQLKPHPQPPRVSANFSNIVLPPFNDRSIFYRIFSQKKKVLCHKAIMLFDYLVNRQSFTAPRKNFKLSVC